MIQFRWIEKTLHYKEHHEPDVPWSEVVQTVFAASKSMRKAGDKLVIDDGRLYILCLLEKETLYVINAKRKR